MANVADAAESKAPKTAVSEKTYVLASDPNTDVGIEKADSFRYVSLPSRKSIVLTVPDAKPGSIQTMLALFGLSTRATNIASFNRHSAKPEDAFPDDTDAVADMFSRIEPDNWGNKTGGGFGIDVEMLYEALTKATGKTPPRDKWIAQVTADPALRKQFRTHSLIRPVYDEMAAAKRGPSTEKSIDDLLGAIGE